ncbi:hypothetical protein [Stenotrophomonas sp. MMGLT7]|uniref:hypothetical protein n=1 Tax=Stenotrophomonas sp. MMGLT7 TaxID=2901227 RepID=UPI001E5E59AB|nr:hypothetical protein [Stenotrophomonas sp. MMGLT7]MCD7098038.1 hypothetical protein [Stenotrophomonas sp. MMGLT7]
MTRKTSNPLGQVSDREKAFTPDKLRNDKAQRKAPDMPDSDPDSNHAEPDDYERLPSDPTRRGSPR